MVAITDLGGLGAEEGPGTAYAWSPPSLIPTLVPWMGVLLLLWLAPNRTAQAWLIWVPLAVVVGLAGVVSWFDFLPSEAINMISEVAQALAFGIAAVFLAATPLGRMHRFAAWLLLGVVLAVGSVVAITVIPLSDGSWQSWVPAASLLMFCVVIQTVALGLAGRVCRRHHRPAQVLVWTAVWLPLIGVVVMLPFPLIAVVASGQAVPWGAILGGNPRHRGYVLRLRGALPGAFHDQRPVPGTSSGPGGAPAACRAGGRDAAARPALGVLTRPKAGDPGFHAVASVGPGESCRLNWRPASAQCGPW